MLYPIKWVSPKGKLGQYLVEIFNYHVNTWRVGGVLWIQKLSVAMVCILLSAGNCYQYFLEISAYYMKLPSCRNVFFNLIKRAWATCAVWSITSLISRALHCFLMPYLAFKFLNISSISHFSLIFEKNVIFHHISWDTEPSLALENEI